MIERMAEIVTFTPNPAIDVSTSVDRVVPTHKLRCSPQQRDPGGGGINVARVVKRLGGDVMAVYPCGGETGALLRHLVEREGIRGPTVNVSEQTREDFTVTETRTGQQYRFVQPGPQLSESEWRACFDAFAQVQPPPRFVVASGSLPPGVPDDFYARASRKAKEWGARFLLDTSGPALARAIEEGVYLVKPNLRELSELVGDRLGLIDSCIQAARRLIDKGSAEIVALTLGHRGALLIAAREAWRAAPLPITPVSAVGAGDSFLGGFVYGLARGESLEECFRTGIAAASATLLNPGTGLCRVEDVVRLRPQVVIEPV
jgi:6-phosphofructokinase 2